MHHNTSTIRRRTRCTHPARGLYPVARGRRDGIYFAIQRPNSCAQHITDTRNESANRILPAVKLRAARPPCEGPVSAPWRRRRYRARPHRIVRNHARRRDPLFKTGNRTVPDGRRNSRVCCELSKPQPVGILPSGAGRPQPRPPSPSMTSFTLPASCWRVKGLDRNSTSSPAPSLSRKVSSV